MPIREAESLRITLRTPRFSFLSCSRSYFALSSSDLPDLIVSFLSFFFSLRVVREASGLQISVKKRELDKFVRKRDY